MGFNIGQGFSRFVKTWTAWQHLLHFFDVVGLRICVSNKCPHAAITAGLGNHTFSTIFEML